MIPALTLALALLQAGPAAAPPKPPAAADAPLSRGQNADGERLAACQKLAESEPERAFEEGKAWENESPVLEAKYCVVAAAFGLGRPALAAAELDRIAYFLSGRRESHAIALAQAGNAWLLAQDPYRALEAFNDALGFSPGVRDLLVDRSRAYAQMGDWKRAEQDLNAALDAKSEDALALTLRAETRLQQGALELALKDAEAALKLEPNSVDALLVRGRIRETMAGR